LIRIPVTQGVAPQPANAKATDDIFSTQAAQELQVTLHLPLQPLQPQSLVASMTGFLPHRIPGNQSLLHLSVGLCAARSGKGGVDETTWPQRHPHSRFSLAKRLRKVCIISLPVSPFCSNPQTISSRGCSLGRSVRAALYSQLEWGTGRPPVNVGSGASVSIFSKNHAFFHPTEGLGCRMEK
jgi:hypothetical protein